MKRAVGKLSLNATVTDLIIATNRVQFTAAPLYARLAQPRGVRAIPYCLVGCQEFRGKITTGIITSFRRMNQSVQGGLYWASDTWPVARK